MIFDKQTLRTQASFAAGIAELGGYPMLVDGSLADIGVRESVEDVARVLGRQASVIVWRTYEQARLEAMAEHAGVPVVNALTDDFHPCQLLADLLTIREHKAELAGLTVAFLGDGACNWRQLLAAGRRDRRHARPDQLARGLHAVRRDGGRGVGHRGDDRGLGRARARSARRRRGADVVVTDTWISMGKEEEAAARAEVFGPYSVTEELFDEARPDAIVMHCLPAYRGKEIDAAVLDGPAERRLGRGGEPPARPEGGPHLAARRRHDAPRTPRCARPPRTPGTSASSSWSPSTRCAPRPSSPTCSPRAACGSPRRPCRGTSSSSTRSRSGPRPAAWSTPYPPRAATGARPRPASRAAAPTAWPGCAASCW